MVDTENFPESKRYLLDVGYLYIDDGFVTRRINANQAAVDEIRASAQVVAIPSIKNLFLAVSEQRGRE